MLYAICRLLFHDFNGKIMGIDGICGLWAMQLPDAATLGEDVELVRGSLRHLTDLIRLLEGATDLELAHPQTIDLKDFNAILTVLLQRQFSPPNHLQFQPTAAGQCLFISPFFLFFWLWSTTRLISKLRKPDEKIGIRITAENPEQLSFQVESPTFARILRELPGGKFPPALPAGPPGSPFSPAPANLGHQRQLRATFHPDPAGG
jgi:hypothetical protein